MFNNLIMFFVWLCISSILIGCSTYKEGDEIATQSFKKMTVQEKTMYDAVEKEWYQDTLVAIRASVGKRDIAPRENSVPFIDIANVIKTNNDVTLKLKSGWHTDHKNRAIKVRWDRIDDNWYKKLLSTIGIKEYKLQELIPIEELIVEEKPKPIFKKAIIETLIPVENTSNLVMFDAYDDLYYEIKKCPEAIELYNKIIEGRILNTNDLKQLMIVSLGCKSRSIKDKLNK